MTQENVVFYNPMDEMDDDLNINFEKIWKTLWDRKILLIKVFWSIMIFFILLTFVLPKKYTVTADLYINKSNNSNMIEVNPYILDEAAGPVVSMGADKAINNEIELIKSELVLDKVIKDNDIKYKKGKKKGEYLTAEAFYGKGKKLKIDNTKNTNVIVIKYTAGKPDFAYGVVSSIITNYIELHKELNTEKSKSDKQLLESEYAKAKEALDKKISQSSGLPVQSMSGIGNLSAMSAFSRSASSAISNIRSQYIAGEKSQIAVTEESQKLAQLATKLEWAKMVEQMSDSSKVLILKEPKQLRPFENSSPKLLVNIILGCILGSFASLVALIYAELKSKKLTYSMLTNHIIFDGTDNYNKLADTCYSFNPKKVLIISFVQLPINMTNSLQGIPNVNIVNYNGTRDYIDKIAASDKIILTSKIGVTDAESYKSVREIIKNQQKDIISDVLV